jgi:hypothetical protein
MPISTTSVYWTYKKEILCRGIHNVCCYSNYTITSICAFSKTTYLEHIWQCYFSDVPRQNLVEIAYCRPWKSRLGLIRMTLDGTKSFIGINSLLQVERVPEYVLTTTIAHELTHYTHGFGSPLPRLYEHPHANNVVERELERRGLGNFLRKCDEWIDKHWFPFYDMQREAGWAGITQTYRSSRDQHHARC